MAAPRGVPAFRPDQLWLQAREPLFWLDSSRKFVWVNHAWEELTGHAISDVAGMECPPASPAQSESIAELAASLAPPLEAVNGEPVGTLTLITSHDGQRHWKRLEYWPFRDQDGKLIGFLGQLRERSTSRGTPESHASSLRVQLLELRDRLRRSIGLESLLGSGPAHDRLLQQIRLAAATNVPVLIVGEPGTGKRLTGRVIHQLSALRDDPLLPLDCVALPAEVLENELLKLGREDTDAPSAPPDEPFPGTSGPLASGKSLTLLIGDIAALPRDLQLQLVKLLRPDRGVRLIATTSTDPLTALQEERLRPELYHALGVLVLEIPPLRNRREDMAMLAQHLLERANQRAGIYCGGFEPPAIGAIEAYDWPGNVRELDRVVTVAHERATSRPRSDDLMISIRLEDIPASIRGNLGAAYLPPTVNSAVKPLDELLTEIERRLIETALSRTRQNKSRAAELLGISRPRLYRRIKELNLPDVGEPDTYPAAAPSAL